jgi:hypothetical protein
MEDPLAVLGLRPGASQAEVEEAYRRLAKQWHPDRADGPDAVARMAAINVAHDLLRAGARHDGPGRASRSASRSNGAAGPRPRRRPAGHWLAEPVRRALGPELLAALEDREQVEVVTPTSTWKSPKAVLAVTDRRLLWLLDDAISDRVRSLRWRQIADVSGRMAWPRRRTANLRVRQGNGRRTTFSDLTPATALQIVRHVQAHQAG